jgi:hypothetical protein
VFAILLYGCEAWIVTNKIETNINSFATSRYRELLKIKWHDKVKNEDILRLVDRKPLIAQVRKRQLGWLGHELRRDAAEPSRVFALYEPEHGRRKRGPKPTSYRQQISKAICGEADQLSTECIES